MTLLFARLCQYRSFRFSDILKFANTAKFVTRALPLFVSLGLFLKLSIPIWGGFACSLIVVLRTKKLDICFEKAEFLDTNMLSTIEEFSLDS